MDWTTARTLYNLVEARWPECAAGDSVLAIERAVRHAGPRASRQLWLACRLLEWEPVWRGPLRRRFWRLPLHERLEAARRWENGRSGFRRASQSWRLLESALAAPSPDQPSPGA